MKILPTFLLSLLLSIIAAANSFALSPQELLAASDRSRGDIKDGLSWNAKILTEEDGDTSDRDFFVRAKGDDAFVEALAPARNRGEVFLFNDRNMWFFKPSLKKPVPISARQKLSGQAANGDIASTHYARDYTPSEEKLEKDAHGEPVHVLLLKAKNNSLTYDQIRYWISEKRKLAVKAEFLTLQGTAFKRAEFEYNNQITIEGKAIPFISKMIISDAKFSQNRSTIKYSSIKTEKIPTSLFQVNSLTR